MVRRFLMLLAVCLILGSVGVQAFGQQSYGSAMPGSSVTEPEAVKLEYKFTPGELLRYKIVMNMSMDMKMDMPGMTDSKGGMQIPNMNMQMVMIMRQRTKKVLPNGDAEIVTALETVKMTDPKGKTQVMTGAKIPTFTAVMGRNGKVKSIQGLDGLNKSMSGAHGMSSLPGMDASSFGQMMGQYAAFPDTPIKVGESWTMGIPFPMGGQLNVDSELLSLDTKANMMTAALKQGINGNIAFKIKNPVKAGVETGATYNIDITGTMAGNSKVNFSVDKGRLLSSNSTMGMHMSLASQGTNDQAGTMVMDMAMVMEMFQLPSGK